MQVRALWRYPVKSMQGEEVPTLRIEDCGAEGDRLWGVVDLASSKVLSAKRTPALLEASAHLDASGAVSITLPDGSTHRAGDAATDEALTAWLGRPVRLEQPAPQATPYELTMDPTDDASEVWDFATPPGSFVDLAAVHLLSTSSLAAMAAAYPKGQWEVRRFRPNVLIAPGPIGGNGDRDKDDDGGAGANGLVEESWVGRTVQIGSVTLSPFMATPRCAMPTRAQPQGLERDTGIAATLRDHNANNLGVYAAVSAGGEVEAGAAVTLS